MQLLRPAGHHMLCKLHKRGVGFVILGCSVYLFTFLRNRALLLIFHNTRNTLHFAFLRPQIVPSQLVVASHRHYTLVKAI